MASKPAWKRESAASAPPAKAAGTWPIAMSCAAMAMLMPPVAHAAVTPKAGPVVRSMVARFADTVEAIIRGSASGDTLRGVFLSSRFVCPSLRVGAAPAALRLPLLELRLPLARRGAAPGAAAGEQGDVTPFEPRLAERDERGV